MHQCSVQILGIPRVENALKFEVHIFQVRFCISVLLIANGVHLMQMQTD
jgi:hypothetical protein